MKNIKGITVFIIFFCFFKESLFASQQSKMIEELEQRETQASEPKPAEVVKLPEVQYTASGQRDPFESYIKKQKESVAPGTKESVATGEITLPSLTIQGLVWGGSNPCVIINNKVLRIGDTIEGVRITEIKKEAVILLFNGQVYNLSSPAALTTKKEVKNEEESF